MHFVYCEVGEIIASIPLDEFFDYFNCIKKDIPWWSFKMEDLVSKIIKDLYSWT